MGSKAILVMFTIEQINDLHERLGSAKAFPEYVRALKALGIERCDSYLFDGHSEYLGQGGHRVVRHRSTRCLPSWKPVNARRSLSTCAVTSRARRRYLEMSMGLAQSGIEKWTVDTGRMTITFYDKAGREMLVEQIS